MSVDHFVLFLHIFTHQQQKKKEDSVFKIHYLKVNYLKYEVCSPLKPNFIKHMAQFENPRWSICDSVIRATFHINQSKKIKIKIPKTCPNNERTQFMAELKL